MNWVCCAIQTLYKLIRKDILSFIIPNFEDASANLVSKLRTLFEEAEVHQRINIPQMKSLVCEMFEMGIFDSESEK